MPLTCSCLTSLPTTVSLVALLLLLLPRHPGQILPVAMPNHQVFTASLPHNPVIAALLRALSHWTPSSLSCPLFSFLPQSSIKSAFVRIQTSWVVLLLPIHLLGSAWLGILILPQDPLESNLFLSICFSAPDNPEELWDA